MLISFISVENTWQSSTVKGECPVVKTKRHPPQSENQKLWGGRGVAEKGVYKTSGGWAAGHLPVYGCGAEREWSMRRMGVGKGEGEEEVEEEEGEEEKRWWWTDGRGFRGRRWAAGCRRTARALPPRGPGPGSQPAAAP